MVRWHDARAMRQNTFCEGQNDSHCSTKVNYIEPQKPRFSCGSHSNSTPTKIIMIIIFNEAEKEIETRV